MRIAIFSDVHGNLTALDAVLADIEQHKPDAIYFAGDLCLFGPRPAACLDRVRQANISSVYGNTDLWVLDPPDVPEEADEKTRGHRQHLRDISQWTQAKLDGDALAWLGSLPFEQRISPSGNPADDLLIVHANPKDVNQVIFPTADRQRLIFGSVQQDQPDEALAPLMAGVNASVIAFGHLHVPNVRYMGDVALANISSVSLPGDGDRRAKYGMLMWDKEMGWSIHHRHITYDVQKELDSLAAHQPPNWQAYGRRLDPG